MVTNTEINVCEETQVKPTTEPSANITEEDFLKAQKLFQQGKKNLILNKYDEATNNIADACKIYSTKYGELNYNCAELYFYYGKALLELSRVENTVLGNALTGVPEDSEPINDSRYGNPDQVPEEEREEIFDKVIDAMCPEETANKEQQQQSASTEPTTTTTTTTTEGGEAEKKTEEKVDSESVVTPKEDAKVEESKKEEVVVNGDEKKEEVMEEGDEEEGDDGEDEEEEEGEDVDVDEKGDKKAEDGTAGAGEEDDDDVTNLQQSWEMFELAKVIYNKQIDSIQDNDEKIKIKIRISECLLKLGEIGIEQEFFEQAINDLKESIKIQEELNVNDRDERLLAETYYQLTLAYQFNNEFDLAKESHKKSTNILDIRIEKLRAKLSDATANLGESEKTEINDEILELEKLLPEMILKLEEINDQNEKQLNLIKEAKECFLSEKPSSNHPSTTTTTQNDTNANGGEVKDITELIKSKRKLSTDKLDTNCKKTKVDDEATTTATTENGEQQPQQNGTHDTEKPMETTVEPTTTTTTTTTPVETQ